MKTTTTFVAFEDPVPGPTLAPYGTEVDFSVLVSQRCVTGKVQSHKATILKTLVSGVAGLSASSSSKADTLNIVKPAGCDN